MALVGGKIQIRTIYHLLNKHPILSGALDMQSNPCY